MTRLILATALVCAGCSPPPETFVAPNVIKEISFYAEHTVQHCAKVCHYDNIPDTWFIQFCRIGDLDHPICFSRAIRHAPWKWETIGERVTITFYPNHGWYDDPILRLTNTGEMVVE